MRLGFERRDHPDLLLLIHQFLNFSTLNQRAENRRALRADNRAGNRAVGQFRQFGIAQFRTQTLQHVERGFIRSLHFRIAAA